MTQMTDYATMRRAAGAGEAALVSSLRVFSRCVARTRQRIGMTVGLGSRRTQDMLHPSVLPYFLAAFMVALLIVSASAFYVFTRSSDSRVTQQIGARSVIEAAHLAHVFYYAVWLPVHMEMPDLSLKDTVHPVMMNVFAQRSTYGLGVVQLRVWDLDGALLWSSDPTFREEQASREWLNTVVIDGTPLWTLLRDQEVRDLKGSERKIDVVRTYYPFQNAPLDTGQIGEVIGVLEITQDVTSALSGAPAGGLAPVWGLAGASALLFIVLLAIIVRLRRSDVQAYRRLLQGHEGLRDSHGMKVQSAKLAAIGHRAAGVTHELNNPLTGIWGLTQNLVKRDYTRIDPKLSVELSMLDREAERAVRIVQNLLSFARASGAEKAYTSVNAAVKAALELRSYHLKINNIRLHPDLQPDLPRTMADPHKIQQVVLNLIINAEQAILDAADSGTLTVKTAEVGDSIHITVTDDGPGVLEENLPKLFDPFFTTKDIGKGTGLGLSICYSILQEHGGTIRAENNVERGTTFIVKLPIVNSDEPIHRGQPEVPPTQEDGEANEANGDLQPIVVRGR